MHSIPTMHNVLSKSARHVLMLPGISLVKMALPTLTRKRATMVLFQRSSMKTVRELSDEHGIDRSTLLKAVQQSRIPGHQSGKTWIVDESSPDFEKCLKSRNPK